jgi:hypothetical protein
MQLPGQERGFRVVAFEDAKALMQFDTRKAQVVELCFLGGSDFRRDGRSLKGFCSHDFVRVEHRLAWLHREVNPGDSHGR